MIGILKALGGVGLAAPQVGLKKRFFIIGETPFYNPWWIHEGSSRVRNQEGCLNYADGKIYKEVKRFKSIKFFWETWDGEKFVKHESKAKGLEAVKIQHEVQHMGNGSGKLGTTIFMKKGKK